MGKSFNYREFVNQLRFQVRGAIPEKYSEYEVYVRDKVYKFSLETGERTANDENFDDEICMCITQIVAEWTFHKTIDLLALNVPQEFHDKVLSDVCNSIYNFSFKNKIKYRSNEDKKSQKYLRDIENIVKKTFGHSLRGLANEGVITKEVVKAGSSQSNFDEMALGDLRVVSVSVRDIMASNLIFSIIFSLAMIVVYLLMVLLLASGKIVPGCIHLGCLCVLIWRYLTYEVPISTSEHDEENYLVLVSLWDILKQYPFVSTLYVIILPFTFLVLLYFLFKGAPAGSITYAVIVFLTILTGFLYVKSDISYYVND